MVVPFPCGVWGLYEEAVEEHEGELQVTRDLVHLRMLARRGGSHFPVKFKGQQCLSVGGPSEFPCRSAAGGGGVGG